MGPAAEDKIGRLARMESDLEWLLRILDTDSADATLLDPWGDERAYVYTARDAVKRVRTRLARLSQARLTEQNPPPNEIEVAPARKARSLTVVELRGTVLVVLAAVVIASFFVSGKTGLYVLTMLVQWGIFANMFFGDREKLSGYKDPVVLWAPGWGMWLFLIAWLWFGVWLALLMWGYIEPKRPWPFI